MTHLGPWSLLTAGLIVSRRGQDVIKIWEIQLKTSVEMREEQVTTVKREGTMTEREKGLCPEEIDPSRRSVGVTPYRCLFHIGARQASLNLSSSSHR